MSFWTVVLAVVIGLLAFKLLAPLAVVVLALPLAVADALVALREYMRMDGRR